MSVTGTAAHITATLHCFSKRLNSWRIATETNKLLFWAEFMESTCCGTPETSQIKLKYDLTCVKLRIWLHVIQRKCPVCGQCFWLFIIIDVLARSGTRPHFRCILAQHHCLECLVIKVSHVENRKHKQKQCEICYKVTANCIRNAKNWVFALRVFRWRPRLLFTLISAINC